MNSFDINYAILQQQHPYYSLQLCTSNKFLKESCEESKYDLLQLWCWPDKSTGELRKLYPNITFSDVAQMSFVYHPIDGTANYYDKLTCFYHACRVGQDNAIRFIPTISDANRFNNFVIAALFICYKYNRLDIVLEWRDKLTNGWVMNNAIIMMNTIYMKLGEKDISKLDVRMIRYPSPSYFSVRDIMQSSMLFEKEELLELCINLAKSGSGNANDMLNYLSMEDGYTIKYDIYEDFIDALVKIIGIERSQDIIRKYIPDFQILYPETDKARRIKVYSKSVLSKYTDVSKFVRTAQAMFIPGLIETILSGQDLIIYYITTGQFDKIIMGKLLRNLQGVSKEQIFKVSRPNVYGIASLNNELAKLLKITRNDISGSNTTISNISDFVNFTKK